MSFRILSKFKRVLISDSVDKITKHFRRYCWINDLKWVLLLSP